MLFHVKQQFNPPREGYGIMQRAQRQTQSSFVQSMLGLSKILKRRAQQNVFSQPARKPRMQIHQRTVRRIKVEITMQTFPHLSVGWLGVE